MGRKATGLRPIRADSRLPEKVSTEAFRLTPNQGRPWDGKPRVRFMRGGQPGCLKNLIRKELMHE